MLVLLDANGSVVDGDEHRAIDAAERLREGHEVWRCTFRDDQPFVVLEGDRDESASRATEVIPDDRKSRILGNAPPFAAFEIAWAFSSGDESHASVPSNHPRNSSAGTGIVSLGASYWRASSVRRSTNRCSSALSSCLSERRNRTSFSKASWCSAGLLSVSKSTRWFCNPAKVSVMGRFVQSSPSFRNSRLNTSPASVRPSSGVKTPTRTRRSTMSAKRSGSRGMVVWVRKRQNRIPKSANRRGFIRKSNSSRWG